MSNLQGKTLFITGASRGIGKEIAVRAARDGANVVIAAKTVEPHPKLEGTIFTAAEEIEAAGGSALPLQVDIRHEEQVEEAIAKTIETFGGLDILINNASAIGLTGTLETPMKRFDLMHGINARGTYMVSRCALPELLKAENPHILNLAPPLNIEEKWFAPHLAYSMAKYGMSLCVLGMAGEFREQGLGVNALWPASVVRTAALQAIGEVDLEACRWPTIMADAAHWILTQDSKSCNGNFFVDEQVLRNSGVTDFDQYAVNPERELLADFFL